MIEAEGVFSVITCVSIMYSYPGIVNICLKNYLNIDIIRHILRNIDTVVVVFNNTEKALDRYCCSISYLFVFLPRLRAWSDYLSSEVVAVSRPRADIASPSSDCTLSHPPNPLFTF